VGLGAKKTCRCFADGSFAGENHAGGARDSGGVRIALERETSAHDMSVFGRQKRYFAAAQCGGDLFACIGFAEFKGHRVSIGRKRATSTKNLANGRITIIPVCLPRVPDQAAECRRWREGCLRTGARTAAGRVEGQR